MIYDHAECARFLIPRYCIAYFISAHMYIECFVHRLSDRGAIVSYVHAE